MGRVQIAIGTLVVATATTVSAGAPTASPSEPRPAHASGPAVVGAMPSLRPVQAIGRRLLDDGVAGSSTFRELVRRLQDSDVIVYVEVRPDLRAGLGGIMRFLGTTETHRIVRITINGRHNGTTMVALLGHELQHAVEIAEARHIDSEKAMRRHYERAGIRIARDTYDSEAAQVTERLVRVELGRSDSHVRLAWTTPESDHRLLAGGSVGGEPMP